MTTNTTKSSAEVEREVESSRANVASTLDELKTRMTPRQLLTEAWDAARDTETGASLATTLGRGIRDNPLPVALVGAGLAWLMSGRSGSVSAVASSIRSRRARYSDRYEYQRYGQYRRDLGAGSYPQDYDDLLDETGGNNSEGLADKARELGGRARSSVSSLGTSVSDSASRAAGAISGAASSLGDRAVSVSRSTSRHAREYGEQALRTGRDLQHRAVNLAEEQPLVLAVAGLALGAMIGAAVRSTQTERQLMGEASDRLKEQARDLAKQGMNETQAVVSRTLDTVKEEASAQGLSPSGAKDVAGDLTDRVKKVAQKGKAKLKEEISAAGTSSGSSDSDFRQT